MKTLSTLSKVACLVAVCFAAPAIKAQTTVNFSQVTDSVYGYCPTPVNYSLFFNGSTTGYTPGVDDMDIAIDFGDGNTSTYSLPIGGSFFSGWFSDNVSHMYTNAGAYTITVIATGTDGNDDTLVKGPVYISASCAQVDGYTYIDHNNNCVKDAADNVAQWLNVTVTDPNNGNIVAFGWSDQNGHYQIDVPAGYSFNINVNANQVSGTQTMCPASGLYSFTAAGSQSFDFGFQTVNSISLNYGFDSTYNCSAPVTSNLMIFGSTSGYNYLTEVVSMQVFFGDGDDTTYTSAIDYSGGFYSYPSHSYTTPGTYTVMVIATAPDGLDDTLYIGPIVVAAGCMEISGDAYIDNNANCVFDAGDDTLSYMNIAFTNQATGQVVSVAYTNQNGHYTVDIPTGINVIATANGLAGAYSVPGLVVTCPSSGSYSFTTTSGTATYNFGFDCTSSQFDISTNVWGWGMVPGNVNATVMASACNNSCNTVSGTLTVSLDPNVTYAGMYPGYPAPSSVTGNTLTWTFSALGNTSSYNWSCFNVYFFVTVDTTVVAGDSLCFSSSASPTFGDTDATNNNYFVCVPAFASYDPNMKEVYPAGETAAGYVAPNTTFTYVVHFQNTGNYPAANIYIMDTLSNNLDVSTFEILGSSHPMTPSLHSANRVKFNFPNINLIDSTTNEPLSHGWVMYRIQAKSGLTDGTEIENTAHIYFDYNPAVVTNTTLNTIDIQLSVNELALVDNTIYPNPANQSVNISFTKMVSGNLVIRDITGRTVHTQNIKNASQLTLDVAKFNAGVYEISLDGTSLSAKRFVVVR